MMPRFIILGAAKAGTSSLFNHLSQHPEVKVPKIKETRFFSWAENPRLYKGYGPMGQRLMDLYPTSIPSSWQGYLSLYKDIPPGYFTGEASPSYLYDRDAAARIRSKLPDVRLVAILRDPIQRAYSSYLHMRRENAEIESFEQALRLEDGRIGENCGLPYRYVAMGRYREQLQRYLEVFGAEPLLVLSYGEFRRNPVDTYQQLCRHIGLSDGFTPDQREQINVSGVPQLPNLYSAVRRIIDSCPSAVRRVASLRVDRIFLKRPPMTPAALDFLSQKLRGEAEGISALLGRPFSF